jgi:hypothetical protein
VTGLMLLLLVVSPHSGLADSCTSSFILPAYAHNDYRNRRPLQDALALGYRGVEADVFRVGTELVVGHERSRLQPLRTLASLYLEPLRERLQACGYVIADSTPFFLNIELKEVDSTAFRSLIGQLRLFDELFHAAPWGAAPVQVTLVGWWPSGDLDGWPAYVRVQRIVTRTGLAATTGAPVGLVSLDYGSVLNWAGRGTVSPAIQHALDAARDSARAMTAPLRVHHVPVNEAVYRWLLAHEGILIGTTDLKGTRALLERIRH